MGGDESGPFLLQALEDSDDAVSSRAARALGAVGCQPAINALADRLVQAQGETVRGDLAWSCAAALGELRATGTIESLILALESQDLNLRIEAAGALGRLGDQRAISPLRRFLGPDGYGDDEKALEEVVAALARLEDWDALEGASDHPRREVRAEAKYRLRERTRTP